MNIHKTKRKKSLRDLLTDETPTQAKKTEVRKSLAAVSFLVCVKKTRKTVEATTVWALFVEIVPQCSITW